MKKQKKMIPYYKFFLVILILQGLIAFNRDFVSTHRYSNQQQWIADIFPATMGLLTAVLINSAIVYGIYRLYKRLTKKKNPDGK